MIEEKMQDDLISRTEAIRIASGYCHPANIADELRKLPPAEPKITYCKDCKHWNLQVGNVKGDGLGSCDFHNVNFVTGEGFCYWAERRDNG